MSETLSAHQILAATASGALIVLFGACYAFFYSINHLRPSRYWPIATLASFALLAASAVVLMLALQMSLFWQSVIVVALIGYYFSPRLIWHLTVATHAHEHDIEAQSPLHSENRGS